MRQTADDEHSARSEAVDWLMRVQEAPGDLALRGDLDAWLAADDANRRAWQRIQRVWSLSGDLPREATPRSTWRRKIFGAGMVAFAASLFVYFAPVLSLRLEADHITGVAELRKVELPDRSVVHLDAGSAIGVDYDAARRRVTLLAGRAFFEVVPRAGTPFVVAADDVTLTAIGTSFDVRTASDGVTVSVATGTVGVALEGGIRSAGTLIGGERINVARRAARATRSLVAADHIALWRERRLIVDGVPLGEVVEELERHFPGAIVLRGPGLGALPVTGVFDLSRPVEALETLARAHTASVTRITPYVLVVSAAGTP